MLKRNKVVVTRQQIAQIRADVVSSDLRKKEYRAQRDAYKTSPKGLAEKQQREAIQAITNEIENKRLQTVEDLKKLRKYLVEHILRDLGLDCEKSQKVVLTEEQVKNVMAKYEANIAYLTENSKQFEKIADGRNNYQYIKLYRDLIMANKAFIKFAPISTFYNSTGMLINGGLPVSAFVEYKNFFTEQGYFDDEMFVKSNEKYFTGLKDIASITNFDEVKKELRSNPSLYKDVNPALKRTIFSNNLALSEALHSAPNIFLYMSPSEMNIAGDLCSALVGKIIARNPEVFAKLPKDFFIVNSPKFVFAEFSKAKIHAFAKDYYDIHPALKRYTEKYTNSLAKAAEEANTDDLSL